MKIHVQGNVTAMLVDDNNNVIVSESGLTELDAVGRLVALHPNKFNLTEVTRKGRPLEGLEG